MNPRLVVVWWLPGRVERRWRRSFAVTDRAGADRLMGRCRARGRAVTLSWVCRYT